MARLNHRIPIHPPNEAPQPLGCGLVGLRRPVTVSWTPVKRADSYRIEVYHKTNLVMALRSTAESAELAGLSGGKRYTWRVQGVSRKGPGPWSAELSPEGRPAGEGWCSFRTVTAPPGPFSLLYPADEQICVPPGEGELRWEAAERATSYRVVLRKEGEVVLDREVGGTSCRVDFEPEASYSWEVTATNEGGEQQAGPWAFETGALLEAPVPTGPDEVNVACSGLAVLRWEPVAGAVMYEVQMRRRGEPWQTRLTPSNQMPVEGVLSGDSWEWRVRALGCPDGELPEPPERTLSVESRNVEAVSVAFSEEDLQGRSSGQTSLSRRYLDAYAVEISVASSLSNGMAFSHWIDAATGERIGETPSLTVVMRGDRALEVVYEPLPSSVEAEAASMTFIAGGDVAATVDAPESAPRPVSPGWGETCIELS